MRGRLELLLYSEKVEYRLIRHLMLILSMILLFNLVVFLRSEGTDSFWSFIPQVALNAVFFFTYAYVCAYFLVPFFLMQKRYIPFVVFFISLGILLSYLKFVFSDYIFYMAISSGMQERMSVLKVSHLLVNTKDMSFIVAIFIIAKYAKDNYYIHTSIQELKDRQLKSEIRLLKNQLDPHVLFNNLNNLYALSLSNSQDTELYLGRLHALLKYYFHEGKNREVLLGRELESIINYIELEKLRYGDRLDLQVKMPDNIPELEIFPFVLFSFVENCFEYGCSLETGNAWAKIDVSISGKVIDFHVSNSRPVFLSDRERDEGCSVAHVRQKLDLMYYNRYQLCIYDEPEHYSIDLKLNL